MPPSSSNDENTPARGATDAQAKEQKQAKQANEVQEVLLTVVINLPIYILFAYSATRKPIAPALASKAGRRSNSISTLHDASQLSYIGACSG